MPQISKMGQGRGRCIRRGARRGISAGAIFRQIQKSFPPGGLGRSNAVRRGISGLAGRDPGRVRLIAPWAIGPAGFIGFAWPVDLWAMGFTWAIGFTGSVVPMLFSQPPRGTLPGMLKILRS